MALTNRQLGPYIMEIRDLIESLLRRLIALKKASRNWQRKRAQLDEQELKAYYEFNREGFADTLRAQTREQRVFFDELEAFLAAWARLSLLLFPIDRNDANGGFRRQRGQALRNALAVPDDSVLSDRDLRDAWMHFDERLDQAIVQKTFGSRHRFIEAPQALPHVADTLLVLELDSLIVRYRSRTGAARQADLRSLRGCILELRAALTGRSDAPANITSSQRRSVRS